MTDSQRLQIRSSEIRQRLREIAALEGGELTDEIRQEAETLQTENRDVEVRLRAALASEPDPNETRQARTETAEDRERRELRARVTLADYIAAAVAQGDAGSAGGAAAEYAAAEGCPGMVPITMLGETAEERAAANARAVEHRAVTPAPADSEVGRTLAPIVPAIFDRSIAGFLGIEMPTVGTGVQSYPVLSTSLSGGMVAEDDAATEGTGAYTVTDADPRRLSGSFRIRKEDIAKLAGLEESLRENLSMVLSDEFDKQGLNGNGTAPNLNGILAQLGTITAPATGAETYARYQAAFSSHIDGLFATMPGDVRALVGVQTLRHMLGVYRANEDARTAYDLLSTQYGGVRSTRRIAAPSSNVQQAVIRRTNPAGDRVAVAPVWMGMEVIRDPYTDAKKGHVIVTGTALVGGVVLLRGSAFVGDSFRLA